MLRRRVRVAASAAANRVVGTVGVRHCQMAARTACRLFRFSKVYRAPIKCAKPAEPSNAHAARIQQMLGAPGIPCRPCDGGLDFRLLLRRMAAGYTEQSKIVTGLPGLGKTVLLGEYEKIANDESWVPVKAEVSKNTEFGPRSRTSPDVH